MSNKEEKYDSIAGMSFEEVYDELRVLKAEQEDEEEKLKIKFEGKEIEIDEVLYIFRYGKDIEEKGEVRLPCRVFFVEDSVKKEPYDLYKTIYVKGFGEINIIEFELDKEFREDLGKKFLRKYYQPNNAQYRTMTENDEKRHLKGMK